MLTLSTLKNGDLVISSGLLWVHDSQVHAVSLPATPRSLSWCGLGRGLEFTSMSSQVRMDDAGNDDYDYDDDDGGGDDDGDDDDDDDDDGDDDVDVDYDDGDDDDDDDDAGGGGGDDAHKSKSNRVSHLCSLFYYLNIVWDRWLKSIKVPGFPLLVADLTGAWPCSRLGRKAITAPCRRNGFSSWSRPSTWEFPAWCDATRATRAVRWEGDERWWMYSWYYWCCSFSCRIYRNN